MSSQNVRRHLREAHLRIRLPQGVDLTAVQPHNQLQWEMVTFNGQWHAGEVCFSWMNPSFNCSGQMEDVWHHVAERFTDVNVVNSAPWWGYGMDRHKYTEPNCILSTVI